MVLLACSLATLSTASAESQAPDAASLKDQIKDLGRQVKEAEDGKFAAQKLLEDGKTKQLSFATEIKKLKETLAGKGAVESTIQEQLVLLQEEVKKLKSDEALHKDLKEKFEAATRELKETKEKLAATAAQLADSSTTASASERSVADASESVAAARKERDEALSKLKEVEKGAQDASKLQKEVEKGKTQTAKLQGEVEGLKEESKRLRSQVSDFKAKAKQAESAVATWQSKAEKAERNVERAEKTLQKALQDHSNTLSALIQAEAKAQEAMHKMERLLTSWLPHWLEQRYHQLLQAVDPAVKQVQPVLDSAWKQGKAVTHQGRVRALQAFAVAKAKSSHYCKEAKPALDRLLAGSKKQLHAFSQKTAEVAGPHFKEARIRSAKAYKASSKHVSKFLDSNPTILRIRRSSKQTLRELEDLAIKQLKQVPLLKQYAKRPTVTYLVWALLAAPIVTIMVPLIALGGGKKKESSKSGASKQGTTSSAVASDRLGKGGNKPKKGRRITEGEETIRVP